MLRSQPSLISSPSRAQPPSLESNPDQSPPPPSRAPPGLASLSTTISAPIPIPPRLAELQQHPPRPIVRFSRFNLRPYLFPNLSPRPASILHRSGRASPPRHLQSLPSQIRPVTSPIIDTQHSHRRPLLTSCCAHTFSRIHTLFRATRVSRAESIPNRTELSRFRAKPSRFRAEPSRAEPSSHRTHATRAGGLIPQTIMAVVGAVLVAGVAGEAMLVVGVLVMLMVGVLVGTMVQLVAIGEIVVFSGEVGVVAVGEALVPAAVIVGVQLVAMLVVVGQGILVEAAAGVVEVRGGGEADALHGPPSSLILVLGIWTGWWLKGRLVPQAEAGNGWSGGGSGGGPIVVKL